jgi:FKBP-type peptidyl-prolyl cis-trans isomerase FkpA
MRMSRILAVALTLLVAAPALAAGPELKTEEQKTVYALGASIAQNLASFALSPEEIELVTAGLRDGLHNASKVEIAQFSGKVRELAQKRSAAAAETEKKESDSFMEKQAKEKGAEKSASGLIYIPVKVGTGAAPKSTDTVKVHYKGTLRDGSVFDSSIDRGTPATFPLNRVIPCWTEGVQKMLVGGKAKLICPAAIAYGDRGAPPKIKPGAALTFEVELLSIEAPPAAAPGAPAAPQGSTPPGHP